MDNDPLARVESDLETIRQAAGLTLPFGWTEVWFSIAVGVGSLGALVWALLAGHERQRWWGLAVVAALIVAYAVAVRIRYRRSSGRSPIRRRDYTIALVLTVLAGGLGVLYRQWSFRLGIPVPFMQGAFLFLVGFAGVMAGIADRKNRYILPFAASSIMCGLAIPLVSISPIILASATFAIAGLAGAAILVWQLRRSAPRHATD